MGFQSPIKFSLFSYSICGVLKTYLTGAEKAPLFFYNRCVGGKSLSLPCVNQNFISVFE